MNKNRTMIVIAIILGGILSAIVAEFLSYPLGFLNGLIVMLMMINER